MAWRFYEACPEGAVPPGGKRRVVVEGYPVCLVNLGGTIHATGDYCPHEAVSLGDGGRVEGETLVCGAHGWRFDVRTGACQDDPGVELPRFPVGRKDGWLYVGFWEEDEEE
ncbi:Rieske 2Fe-2S domain-containing protein [Myxococcota bacterium]|nr:Rieske 2Fe-2S domain-containing protein [Myxococcota bacterium]